MAITTTLQGDNSVELSYPAATVLADLIQAVEDWLVLHGWALYDASAGTNARAYRAVCIDGLAYKYVVLDFNTANRMYIKTYNAWNSGTHAGADLAYQSDNTVYAQQIDLTNGGKLYLYATARYVAAISNNAGVIGSTTGGSWCGCFEVTRDNPEDTAALGYPCWGWAHGYLMFVSTISVFSFCRMRNGVTGASASQNTFVSTEMGSGGVSAGGSAYALYGWIPSTTQLNGWNSKNWVWTLRVGGLHATPGFEKRGRVCGLHLLTKSLGSAAPCVDDINIKVNADDFVDPIGTLMPHWILSESSQGGRWAIGK